MLHGQGRPEFFDTSEIERLSSRVPQYFDDTPQNLIFDKGFYICVIGNQSSKMLVVNYYVTLVGNLILPYNVTLGQAQPVP